MSYEAFASYYDGLMQNVDYEKRAEYFCSLAERVGHTPGLALDLACGTGSLTLALARRGWDIYGVDASPAMLSVAQEKAAQEGVSLLFLCQPMQKLDLYGTVNTVICTPNHRLTIYRGGRAGRNFPPGFVVFGAGGLVLF